MTQNDFRLKIMFDLIYHWYQQLIGSKYLIRLYRSLFDNEIKDMNNWSQI
jgi:hypothetical protein